ncbi:MAG: transketolase C-terminal domain-containing protein, partial [Bacteroidota bacterium]
SFDLSYLRLVPGMVIMAPKDESELRDMLYTAVEYKEGPIALRYPRGNGEGVQMKQGFDLVPIGKGETVRRGDDVALLAIGEMVYPAMKAAEQLAERGTSCEVVNMRFVKPLDEEILESIASRFKRVVTLENNTKTGGFGGAVMEHFASRHHSQIELLIHGLPDRFVEHGSPAELMKEVQLDTEGIVTVVSKFLTKE